ncbi:MAG: FAD-dependent oxidoreductase [Methanomassiliicoccales archaeon]|nr:FAD-dependent oxidoreductase [Methanomassiliicoccales archaeon]
MEHEVLDHDVIVIGGGLTGLRAAVELSDRGVDVCVLAKTHPLRSHSVAAQGGVNASLSNNKAKGEDSWQSHAFDTVKGSDYLADQDSVEVMCKEAPEAVIEMEHWGTVFSRDEEGRIAQRPFGGAGFPRTCYAADRTGHNLLHTLYEQSIRAGVRFYEERYVIRLVVEDGRCEGCVAIDLLSGDIQGFAGESVLLATGGYGRIYKKSTNAHINTGDGASLALRAGAQLKDMEFVQFHPTTLYGTNILITEGARGEGGILKNKDGERFMKRYAPTALDLAPRDIVARAAETEIIEGRGLGDGYVDLDLTGIGEAGIDERLPGIREIAIDFAGIDPVERPIPVQPGQHYSMGGVDVDADLATSIPGLYAAGECSCVSVHGANRLGGNSLLETLVFGKRAGRIMAQRVSKAKAGRSRAVNAAIDEEIDRIGRIAGRRPTEREPSIRSDLKNVMTDRFGIFRRREQMEAGLSELAKLGSRMADSGVGDPAKEFNQALIALLELQGMLLVAETVAKGALWREESRGSHFRTDFPKRDDGRFLAHTIARLERNEIVLGTKPVRLGPYPVEARRY